MKRMLALIIAVALLFWFGSSMIFVVDQREYAIVSSFGSLGEGFDSIKRVIKSSGVQVKLPMPLESVVRLDKRIQTINYADADGYAMADTPNVLISLMIKWRIVEPREYFTQIGTGNTAAQDKLSPIVSAALRKQLAQRTLANLLSSDQQPMLAAVYEQIAAEIKALGVEVVDVRLKRIDLPAEASKVVYQQMQAEHQQMLTQLRSNGAEQAQKIRAAAESQRADILALAYKNAQGIKGKGDAQASGIEAEALRSSPHFYRFFRRLEIYRHSFSSRDVMIVDPSSEFFHFMRRP